MNKINIVLYSPEIPQNTGNISRTAAVTGSALHIIKPMGFEVTDKNLKRAGLDYWDKLDIYYYEDYQDFINQNPDAKLYFFSSKAKYCYTEMKYEAPVYLVFGCETFGLPEDLVRENLESSVRIPMLPTLRCLNLSNAVAVAVYEALRQSGFEDFERVGRIAKEEFWE
jgi:tRNA (cytidine/uridine-2'-O-)-methyltransferase